MFFAQIKRLAKRCALHGARAARGCAHAALWLFAVCLPLSVRAADSVGASNAGVVARVATPLRDVVTEALQNNPEIQAARNEREAAQHRIAPAGALDDPMLEAGFINVPSNSFRFDREDMTMKMIGLSQRLEIRSTRRKASITVTAKARILPAMRVFCRQPLMAFMVGTGATAPPLRS